MQRFLVIMFGLLVLAGLVPNSLYARANPNPAQAQSISLTSNAAKIDLQVLTALQQSTPTQALVVLAEQADVSGADHLSSKLAKGQFVYNAVRAVADRTQPSIRALLDQRHLAYRAYYVTNAIAVDNLDAATAALLAARTDVGRIAANPRVKLQEPSQAIASPEAAHTIEWNIQKIKADKVWAAGFRGKGIVVANQDTGVQGDHPALKTKYRGYTKKNGAVNNNYNWWDAVHHSIAGGSNPCGFSSPAPCDDAGHGTHTMGTLVGGDKNNQIGVAPGARWISCRDMDQEVGQPSTYIECAQFFLAPWDSTGGNPNPALAPDVISNSWYCPPSEGCEPDSVINAMNNLRAAGIFLAVSAGNSGSACSTISDPPEQYASSTTVGATDSNDALTNFSSRGPVTIDSSNRRKPDLSAPGEEIRSSYLGSTYEYLSGTSMAAPHVAGAVALLWQANPKLRGDVSGTEKILFNSAFRHVTIQGNPNQSCGGTTKDNIPNNLFGYGRLNVWKAYQQARP